MRKTAVKTLNPSLVLDAEDNGKYTRERGGGRCRRGIVVQSSPALGRAVAQNEIKDSG